MPLLAICSPPHPPTSFLSWPPASFLMNPHYWEIRRRRRGRGVRRKRFCIIVAGPPLRWNCPSVVSIKRWNIKRFPLASMLPRWKLTAAWLIGCSFKYLSWPRDHYFGVDVCSAAPPPPLHLCHSVSFPPDSFSDQYCPSYFAHVGGHMNKQIQVR